MATAIKIPDIGTTVDKVTLVGWLLKEGDAVNRGDALCEIETDKAVSELESIAKGTLLKIVAQEDDEVAVGDIIAWVGKEGEEIPGEGDAPAAEAKTEEKKTESKAAKSDRPKVAPMLANLAKKEGVDLSSVEGSGPGGRITREDILNAKSGGAADKPAAGGLSNNQKAVAKQVAKSHSEIPPINMLADIDMTAALAKRQSAKDAGKKLSIDAMFVKALADILPDFPNFRSKLTGEQVELAEKVNIGVAVSGEKDLYIPVVQDAASKSLDDIQAEIASFAGKAKQGTFSPADLGAASMSVSNLGMYPVRAFAAIIPTNQAAALAIPGTREEPFVKNGELKTHPVTTVTLSVDHRLINGREAAEFIKKLKETMETL